MDDVTINGPPHPTRWAWLGSSAPLGELRDAVEQLILRTMPYQVVILDHDHAPADDLIAWVSLHASGQAVVAILDGDHGPLTGFFSLQSDAILFKLRFG